jgi:hypothetical protein
LSIWQLQALGSTPWVYYLKAAPPVAMSLSLTTECGKRKGDAAEIKVQK